MVLWWMARRWRIRNSEDFLMSSLQIVTDFCAAWDRLDWEAVYAALAEDIFYHNIPMAPCVGIAAFKAFVAGFPVSEAQFEIHHIVAAGDVVMTERTDRFLLAGKPVVIRVMGVFVLKQGKISEWRDYFDLAEFMSQMPAA
jgi:limonene-1,2-epoxide hydrolase